MVCEDIYGECRCYAYSDSPKTQFCGKRRGPNIIPCSPECCVGGCEGPHPYRIVPRPPIRDMYIDSNMPLLIIWFVVVVLTLFIYIVA
jgi:hypothetical protein